MIHADEPIPVAVVRQSGVGAQRREGLVGLVATLVIGIGIGLGIAHLGGSVGTAEASAHEASEGVAIACGAHGSVVVNASGLPDRPLEVLVPLRGDDVLLPVTTDTAVVLTGSAVLRQHFRPDAGHLVLHQRLGRRPAGTSVVVEIDGRRSSLPVVPCQPTR